MGGFDVGLGDGEIAAHHVERGVTSGQQSPWLLHVLYISPL